MPERKRETGGEGNEGFACVEPALGSELWQYGLPSLDANLRERLERHVQICDACRMALAIERRVASGLKDGTLRLDTAQARRPLSLLLPILRPTARSVWARVSAAAGACALAASVALMILLPPHAGDSGRLSRSETSPIGFTRPVEGEVTLDRTPELSWQPIEGATAYRVVLREIGGTYTWTGETQALAIRVPANAPLPSAARARALLEPIPADVAAPGGVSVSFETAGLPRYLGYRVGASAAGARVAGAAGAALLAASLLIRLWRPPRASYPPA